MNSLAETVAQNNAAASRQLNPAPRVFFDRRDLNAHAADLPTIHNPHQVKGWRLVEIVFVRRGHLAAGMQQVVLPYLDVDAGFAMLAGTSVRQSAGFVLIGRFKKL